MRTTISADEAEKNYGITCVHERMDNSEYRFRLRAADGSSYIRTVTLTGTWQNAHFHKTIRETYIVQDGWMAIAMLFKGKLVIRRYPRGAIVTTECLVKHNVYLPAKATIHTVKHGVGGAGDIWESAELNALTRNISEKEIATIPFSQDAGGRDMSRNRKSKERQEGWPAQYSEDYRHFDNLTWQLPAWSTAVFAAVLSALAFIFSTEAGSLPTDFGLAKALLGRCVLFGAVFFFGAGYYALFRWRVHQSYTERSNAPTPLGRWVGAQLFLQLVTGAQAAILVTLLLVSYKVPSLWWLPFVALAAFSSLVEWRLCHHHRQEAKRREENQQLMSAHQ